MTNDKIKEICDLRDSICVAGEKKYNVEDRSATLDDCVFIYKEVCKIKPETVVEIGTWHGLTSRVIAMAMRDCGINGTIYTCDKHNVYLGGYESSENILYHNKKSSTLLKSMRKSGIKIDMAFIDAMLYKGDAKIMDGLFVSKSNYIIHDYFYKKGYSNYMEIVSILWHRRYAVNVPVGDDKFAVFTIKEV